MTTAYRQYNQWTPVPQLHSEPSLVSSLSELTPIPPKVPIFDVSGGLAAKSNRDERKVQGENPTWKRRNFAQKWLGGLQLVLRAYAGLTLLILLVNIGWIIWASKHYGSKGGYGTIQRGNCNITKSLNLWLHLAINVLSTGLLLASNAFMGASTAPSREEVDLAHRKRKWLSVGLLSFRNLTNVSVRKVLVCVVLALTSLPVHLFYNSVIFPSLSGNDYLLAVVTEDFLSGGSFDVSSLLDSWDPLLSAVPGQDAIRMFHAIQQNVSRYERLDNENCIKAYSKKLVPDRRHVVLVSSAKNASNAVLAFDVSLIDNEGDSDPTNWICSEKAATCDATPFLQDPQNWEVYGYPVLYCLSEQTEESCSIKFSSDLAIIIIFCNFLKLCTELYVLFFGQLDQALTCVGDAIASFLTVEDKQTRDMCLMSVKDISQSLTYSALGRQPRFYINSRPRWANVISKKRWIISLAVLLISILLVAILYVIADTTGFGSKGFDTSARGLWRIGFGQIDPEILIASDNFGTPITLSLLANTPQLILAVIYYLYNGMMTAFFTAQEYSSFASTPKHLRVSSPAGKQEGTWFLGMPPAWGIFWLAMQTLLHWFVSQGFFVVDVSVFNIDGSLNTGFGSISNCGFSPLAMICSMVLAALMMLLVILLGLRRFPMRSPPPAGNSSAAISAACHPGLYQEKTAFMALKWGAISSWPDGTGHCSFAAARDEDGFGVAMEEVHEGIRYK